MEEPFGLGELPPDAYNTLDCDFSTTGTDWWLDVPVEPLMKHTCLENHFPIVYNGIVDNTVTTC